MFLAIGIHHAMRMRKLVICGLPGCTEFFSPLPHKWQEFGKKIIERKIFI